MTKFVCNGNCVRVRMQDCKSVKERKCKLVWESFTVIVRDSKSLRESER